MSQIELDEEHWKLQFEIDEERKLINACRLEIFSRRKALKETSLKSLKMLFIKGIKLSDQEQSPSVDDLLHKKSEVEDFQW